MPTPITLLSEVKAAQRVNNSNVNNDYEELIAACKNELKRLGISEEKIDATEPDTEVLQACKLYVHWMTDYEQKGAQWGVMYTNYVNSLRMTAEYLQTEEE